MSEILCFSSFLFHNVFLYLYQQFFCRVNVLSCCWPFLTFLSCPDVTLWTQMTFGLQRNLGSSPRRVGMWNSPVKTEEWWWAHTHTHAHTKILTCKKTRKHKHAWADQWTHIIPMSSGEGWKWVERRSSSIIDTPQKRTFSNQRSHLCSQQCCSTINSLKWMQR